MNNNNKTLQEDEIDLKELFVIIAGRKILIAAITSIITLGAIIYAYFITPIYEVKSNIQVGFIGENLIDEPNTLVKKLNIIFNVEDKISIKDKYVSEVTSITTNKNLKNFIEIKTEAISNEEALKKNQEVITYIKESYRPKIEQYEKSIQNKIEDFKKQISILDNFETNNVKEQIKVLKTQEIVKIDEQLKFLKDSKIASIDSKINFHSQKLKEYTTSINKLYKDNKATTNAAAITISSIQMVNYQNLILNSQNDIEDLKVEKEILKTQTIPNLIKDRENITNDTIRKLQQQLDVDLPSKKVGLNQQIAKLNYNLTEQNVKNCDVVGEYIIDDYAIKPKKKLIVVVAFITGLILSIFLVFFLNFIRNESSESTDLK